MRIPRGNYLVLRVYSVVGHMNLVYHKLKLNFMKKKYDCFIISSRKCEGNELYMLRELTLDFGIME